MTTTLPAEVLQISPEALEVANCYLQCQDSHKVADELDMPLDLVTSLLGRREVKAYVDNVFLNLGFNNRFRMRNAMDAIIKKKFQELEDSEMGSTKDIADLLALSHKMTMDELSRQIELEKLQQTNIKNQLNIQVNNNGEGSKYDNLMRQLMNADNK